MLKFEGDFLNGKIWKGNKFIYFLNCILRFTGECLNGEINGKGKEYYCNQIVEYEGEFLNGKRNGKRKEYNDKGE